MRTRFAHKILGWFRGLFREIRGVFGLRVDPAKVKERLAKNKVEVKGDETFHDAAGKRKVTPMEVLKVVLVENFELK